jgi:hypothetical protein
LKSEELIVDVWRFAMCLIEPARERWVVCRDDLASMDLMDM